MVRTVPEKVLEEEQQTAPDARPQAGTAVTRWHGTPITAHRHTLTQHTVTAHRHTLAPLPPESELRGLLDFCKSLMALLPHPCVRQEHGSGVEEGVLWQPGSLAILNSSPIIDSREGRGL